VSGRPLTALEIEIIGTLLKQRPTLQSEFVHNANTYRAETLDSYGSIRVTGGPTSTVDKSADGPVASGLQPDHVEIRDEPRTEPQIEYILFYEAGRLVEMQVFKQDGSPIATGLHPDRIEPQ
jgi:hypothetical protein